MKTFQQFLSEFKSNKGITVQGVHYSHTAGLTHLDGTLNGSGGIKGAEHERLHDTDDSRIKSRAYFYNHTGSQLPKPEAGLGPHVHTATLSNIYDPHNASDEQRAEIDHHKKKYTTGYHNKSNTFESSVMDAGYDGYTNNGMTVVMGKKHIPVTHQN
jgi:hypothetical protein